MMRRFGLWLLVLVAGVAANAEDRIVVGSKPFAESYLLGEVFAQIIEADGMAVERRLGLGSTEICFGALRTGAIDVYPEYTGTGLMAVLGQQPTGDSRQAYRTVAREFAWKWGVRWLPPLGFENTYAIAVRRDTSERYKLRNLSDLVGVAPHLTAGLSPDFIGREDGLPGLRRTYGLDFRDVRSLLQAVKYRALAAGTVDLIDGYSTDGAIAKYDLVVLEDDRGFFPPYEAAPLVGARLWHERPDAVRALASLAGRIDDSQMRILNERVEVRGEEVAEVARSVLMELGLVSGPATRLDADAEDRRGPLLATMWNRRAELARLSGRHLFLVVVSVGFAVLTAVPLGLLLERRRRAAEAVIRAIGLLQTLPSIALLAFMIPLLGIGVFPALVALYLYSLFPIVRNTYTGIRDADPHAVAAATALGMTPFQLLWHVRLPLAAPVIMAGIRTAAVINVGTATLAAFIGAGGLGDPIVAGLALADTTMTLSGAIPAALLALAVDAALSFCERLVRPAGPVDAD
jgi:osmoprotectant transport system permease protein